MRIIRKARVTCVRLITTPFLDRRFLGDSRRRSKRQGPGVRQPLIKEPVEALPGLFKASYEFAKDWFDGEGGVEVEITGSGNASASAIRQRILNNVQESALARPSPN